MLGRLLPDVSPLRDSRDFRLLFIGQLISMVGRQITVVAVPFQTFQITHSALAVGMLGLVQVVPLIGFSFIAGAAADAVDRRRLLLVTNSLLAGCSGLYLLGARVGDPSLAYVYAVTAAAAALSAFEQPARRSAVPRLVEPHQVGAAIALQFSLFVSTLIVGPALGGLVISHFSLATAYLVDVITFGGALIALGLMSPLPPAQVEREPPLRAIRSGLRFARSQPVILGGFLADICAMVFGMPKALFPVLAATVFNTGADGVGLLYAAPGVGALLAAILATGWVGRIRHQGRAVIVAVAVWGSAIVGFGLVSVLWAGLLLLAVAGAADGISAICRSTMLQVITPDEFRGRMSATFSMVVVGGNQLGDVEAGAVAAAFTPRISVVSGGILCLVGVAATALLFPALRRYDATAPPPATAAATMGVAAPLPATPP
jgi:MFS family permease